MYLLTLVRSGKMCDLTGTNLRFWSYFRIGGDSTCAGINRHVVGVQVPCRKGNSESILTLVLRGTSGEVWLKVDWRIGGPVIELRKPRDQDADLVE